ncbi:MAG: hypothetical protein GF372_06135 [Candidatus Marinimicrobia bacterium]|nr:hypothetical protein [Candidatus Neomarinimicrobiota bacterium]
MAGSHTGAVKMITPISSGNQTTTIILSATDFNWIESRNASEKTIRLGRYLILCTKLEIEHLIFEIQYSNILDYFLHFTTLIYPPMT